jgi:hypothetical protein
LLAACAACAQPASNNPIVSKARIRMSKAPSIPA